MAITEIIFPIFAIALIGYLATAVGPFKYRDIQGLSRFVFDIAIPVMLFNALAGIELPESPNWAFLLSYYLSAVLLFLLGLLISRRFFHQGIKEQSIFGLGSAYSNAVLMGLPIITAGLGEAALLPVFTLISIHSATLFFLVTLMAERGEGEEGGRSILAIAGQALKRLATNPIIIGLALGLLFNLLAISLPAPVQHTIELISDAALATALFVLGASLSAYKFSGHFLEAGTLILLKLIVMPALVALLAFVIFDLDPLWAKVAVLMASMPVGVNVYIFSQKYQANIEPVSTAVLVSTTLSVVSISALLALFI